MGATPLASAADGLVILSGEQLRVEIDPATLGVTATVGGEHFVVSVPQESYAVSGLEAGDSVARWSLTEHQLTVGIELEADGFTVVFETPRTLGLRWPVIPRPEGLRGLVVPKFEGIFVSLDDENWWPDLIEREPLSMTESLSMPFLGISLPDRTVTFIAVEHLGTELQFSDPTSGAMASFIYTFRQPAGNTRHEVCVRFAGPSLIEPARQYRQWLKRRGAFVPLRDKIAKTPVVARLLGAPHAYLWRDTGITRHDITDWRGLASYLASSRNHPSAFQRRIRDALQPDIRELMVGATRAVELSDQEQTEIARDLSRVLRTQMPGFEANVQRLRAEAPGVLDDQSDWGGGVSLRMIDRLAAAGFDRFCLTLGDLDFADDRPSVAGRAFEAGFLLGPYDSYHSIHHPDQTPTWVTAQFDSHLYEAGGVVRWDGQHRPGYQRRGRALNSIVARPYVERRVTELIKNVPFSAWFIDCDAYGQLYRDHAPDHLMTQAQDMAERLDRLRWISETQGVAVGSEGGAAYAAGAIHFAHGMVTPAIAFADPERKDPDSPFWWGDYKPTDAPRNFMMQVPLRERYIRLYYDPSCRLPLYETVFHDSVVATHHWGSGSLKFRDAVGTISLIEQLYNVPPMYHLNLDELEKHRETMQAHFAFFSPLHRVLAFESIIEFEWMTEDRLVQRTTFSNQMQLIANFGATAVRLDDLDLPARSVTAQSPEGRVLGVFRARSGPL